MSGLPHQSRSHVTTDVESLCNGRRPPPRLEDKQPQQDMEHDCMSLVQNGLDERT